MRTPALRTSKRPFHFPLPPDALPLFTHPDPAHAFHEPFALDGEVVAANGHVAIKVYRGHFSAEDYGAANQEMEARIRPLPWHLVRLHSPGGGLLHYHAHDWRNLDEVRGLIYDWAPIQPFIRCGRKWKFAPSPGIRVGGSVIVPLSLLQLIARLPRVEVLTRELDLDAPLVFRFTGGIGVIGNHRLMVASHGIFNPGICE